MARFTFTKLTHPAHGVFDGSGLLQANPNWRVPLPHAVHLDNTSPFAMSSTGTRRYSTLFFQMNEPGNPRYYALCYGEGLTSFSHANLFFHPNPGASKPP